MPKILKIPKIKKKKKKKKLQTTWRSPKILDIGSVFLIFFDFCMHNVLIENIHVKHSIFVNIFFFLIPPLKLNLVQKSEVTVHPLKFIKSIANTNKIN